jgi:hypothetical protein
MATATTPRRSARSSRKAITVDDMLHMSQPELDDVFRVALPGPVPTGTTRGTAIVAPGTPLAPPLVPLLGLAWRGKAFSADGCSLRNRIGPLGVPAIRAEVYRDESWLDRKEAIVLDYARSTPGFRPIRDEIREVAPGRYLGIVYWNRSKTINFALELG